MAIDLAALEADLADAQRQFTDPNMRSIAMAMATIFRALGATWWEQFGPDALQRPYLLLTLADYLFELREAPGFDAMVERFRARPLRPTYLEAQIAAMFAQRGFAVEVIREQGKRGADFDLTAVRDGVTINVEVTERQEEDPDPVRFARKLRKKVAQLPPGQPSVLAVVIPDSWGRDQQRAEAVVPPAAETLFRASKRINMLLVCWTLEIEQHGRERLFVSCFRSFENPAPRIPMPDLRLTAREHRWPDTNALGEELARPTQHGLAELQRLVEEPEMSFAAWFRRRRAGA